MTKYFYIPVSSQNFNTLFATESISPPSHYSKRSFGTKRYVVIDEKLKTDYILLFDNAPKFELIDDDSDATIFYVRIEQSRIKDEVKLIKEDEGKKIYSIFKTIYFNITSPSFIFIDEIDKKRILAKSISSIETKTVIIYKDTFLTLKECNIEPVKFNLKGIEFPKVNELNKLLIIDGIYDRYKGFIYGYFIGRMFPDSIEYIELRKNLQNILNYWGALKNKISIKSSTSKSLYSSTNKESDKLRIKLELSFKELYSSLSNFFPDENEENMARKYLEKSLLRTDVNQFLEDVRKIPILYENLITIAKKNTSSYVHYIDSVYQMMMRYLTSPTPKYYQEEADIQLKEAVFKLNKSLETIKFNKNKNTISPDIESIKLSEKGILFTKNDLTIAGDDLLIFETILTSLFINGKSKIGELDIHEKLDNLITIGFLIKEKLGENSEARKYLLKLYNSINTNTSDFDIMNTDYHSLSNFAAFMIKPDSLEQLSDYMDNKYIKEKYLAYSYWGAFNGFAAMGKVFTKYILEDESKEFYKQIDLQLFVLDNIDTSIYIQADLLNKKHTEPIRNTIISESKNANSFVKKETALTQLENSEDLHKYLEWTKIWLDDIVSKIKFGDDSNVTYDVNLLRENFIKSFCTPRKKGYTQEIAKKVFKKINFEKAFIIGNN